MFSSNCLLHLLIVKVVFILLTRIAFIVRFSVFIRFIFKLFIFRERYTIITVYLFWIHKWPWITIIKCIFITFFYFLCPHIAIKVSILFKYWHLFLLWKLLHWHCMFSSSNKFRVFCFLFLILLLFYLLRLQLSI